MGLTFPATSALVADPEGHISRNAGTLLAANTIGAIVGTFVVPFVVIPAVGSPTAIGLIAVMDSAALMLALVLGALLLQRGALGRAYDSGVSTWQAVKEFRPTPMELRRLPEVRTARVVVGGAAAALVLGAPYLLHAGSRGRLTLLPIYAIVAVSLVILTGWAGQVSLGQFGIVGAGAAVAGGLAANHNIDFFAACLIGMRWLRRSFIALSVLYFVNVYFPYVYYLRYEHRPAVTLGHLFDAFYGTNFNGPNMKLFCVATTIACLWIASRGWRVLRRRPCA